MQMKPGRALSSRWLRRVFSLERNGSISELPLYLCPAFRSPSAQQSLRCQFGKNAPSFQTRRLHSQAAYTARDTAESYQLITRHALKTLPAQCSGCGGLTQTAVPDQPGYFDMSRKVVQQYLGPATEQEEGPRKYGQVVEQALQGVDMEEMERLGVDLKALLPDPDRVASRSESRRAAAPTQPPLCDRCHHLVHHHTGNPIYHPSIEALRDTIDESPYKYNHIYHVLDAADFPMSLLPRLNYLVDLTTIRSKNRRAAEYKFHRGRTTEISFIISRSDLLAPKKEQVDAMMTYLRETLRASLGRIGKNLRLGNVRCISAKRNWWTKELKDEIWERGGAGWMVGKVNVGKSQLFQAVFPKGRSDWKPPKDKITIPVFAKPSSFSGPESDAFAKLLPKPVRRVDEDEALLPPAQPETDYPAMPVVSSLPGTTASPIRMRFGGGKGELIDLPGLSRGELEDFVQEDKRSSLIMKSRVTPEQQILKPGRSLLIGGFIRITPQTPDLVFLTYAFTPLEAHVSATPKAILVQEQSEEAPKVENIALPGVGEKIKLAGSFKMRYDVTKARAGPITRRNAANIPVERLPYRIFSIDILIEGCGWVEIVAQVRTKQLYEPPSSSTPPAPTASKKPSLNKEAEWDIYRLETLDLSEPEPEAAKAEEAPHKFKDMEGEGEENQAEDAGLEELNYPVVDVYSPEGRFVAARPPMNAWLMNQPKNAHLKSRPRKSMKGVKKMDKVARRVREAGSANF
ncbi:hypothetical protein B0H63DRAFT_468730 [Podospora didyma]|uniref:Genetic interactor of prohibitins 3, mitochondrial n=1 Tax=Podospora didyma TaxID=330526 RepID=A0AAE0NT21_9PEZI|nr:hypothetical protein B0H63DRAFT_468730 [Podospora didyma]